MQDPCQIVRKSFGDKIANDFRFAIAQAVGEENIAEMYPNKSNNYCCGGGGGFLQSGFKDQRLEYGRLKDEQIKQSGAQYCIAGCHNCHAQIHELVAPLWRELPGRPFLDDSCPLPRHPRAE